ncbi:Phg-2220-C domain-containing protein [Sporosarcina sp. ANT_H38]
MDKTKWYRINYTKLHYQAVQHAPSTTVNSAQEEVRIAPSTAGKMPLAITKKNKSIKKDLVENDLDIVSVIDYLNDKACKQFKASSKVTARLGKGVSVADCKKVIDTIAKNWLDDPHWQKYLRPSTLVNATNSENYLEESRASDLPENSPPKPLELDFSKEKA